MAPLTPGLAIFALVLMAILAAIPDLFLRYRPDPLCMYRRWLRLLVVAAAEQNARCRTECSAQHCAVTPVRTIADCGPGSCTGGSADYRAAIRRQCRGTGCQQHQSQKTCFIHAYLQIELIDDCPRRTVQAHGVYLLCKVHAID